VAPDTASSGRQILAIAATLDRHVSAITMPPHTVVAMRGDFLNAYDLNFFIKTFDLGHERFLMKMNARCRAARCVV
jgi:hypothetical protein